jgi:hypothetical protein
MRPGKKLQVFVSSTYNDLREERQAAVEAILTAGHIPAGMELFTAGDQSQMDVIRRWIDESDVFLLILGGRYGSLEPTTGKSYTHLEYEYATERGKPLFAVVLDDTALDKRIKKAGRGAVEIENAAKLRQFREVVLFKMVRFWSDIRDIKLAVYETMGEFNRRTDLTGWIPGDQAVATGLVAEEIARLTKENVELRRQLAETARPTVAYHGLSFTEISGLLRSEQMSFSDEEQDYFQRDGFEIGSPATLLELLWGLRHEMLPGGTVWWKRPQYRAIQRFRVYGLVEIIEDDPFEQESRFHLTADGRKFLLRLMAERRPEADEA